MGTDLKVATNLWLVVDPLSGHRSMWAIELGKLAHRMKISLGVIAVQNPRKEFTAFSEQAQIYFTSTILVESDLSLKELLLFKTKSEKDCLFLFIDLEKYVIWLIRNRIHFKGVFMRPYQESRGIRSFLAWISKRFLVFLSRFIPNSNIRLLSIPFQRERKTKKHWVSDDLTLNKCISSVKVQAPERINRYKNTILVPGYLDIRKSINLAVVSFASARCLIAGNLELVFIGEASQNFRDAFAKVQSEHISLEDNYLSDQDYLNALYSARMILLPYANRGASGIVIEALVIGTPVVIIGKRTWKNVSILSKGMIQNCRPNPKSVVRAISKIDRSRSSEMTYILNTEKLTGISSFFLG